jgi:hypothetical protein
MANPKHLQMLTRGVVVWNMWRDLASHIRPKLSEADLSGASLSWATLRGCLETKPL